MANTKHRYLTLEEKEAFVFQNKISYLNHDLTELLHKNYIDISELDSLEKLRIILRNIAKSFPNAKYAEKAEGCDLEYFPLDEENIERIVYNQTNVSTQAHEIAFFALLCAYFKTLNLDYLVGLTECRRDGGVDVVVSKFVKKNELECEFMFDVKSGKNTTRDHVEWEYVKGSDKYLVRVVAKGSKNLGSIKNKKNKQKRVYDLSLERQIRNLIAVFGWKKQMPKIDLLIDEFAANLNKITI